MDDLYEILDIESSATPEEIRNAYRKRIRAVHPDAQNGDEADAKKVTAAYAILKDPENRRRYDQHRRESREAADVSPMASGTRRTHRQEHQSVPWEACLVCSRLPAVYVTFRSNIGLVFVRRSFLFEGRLCSNCGRGMYRGFQARNFAAGWWGIVSFFATIAYLISNRSQFGAIRDLESPQPDDPDLTVILEGKPIWKRPSVIVVASIFIAYVTTAAIASAVSTARTADVDVSSDANETPRVASDSATDAPWTDSSCIAIESRTESVRPVHCSSPLAGGAIVSIETSASDCEPPADGWVELGTGRVACTDDWSYDARDAWSVGACVEFEGDWVSLTDCASGRVDGRVAAVRSSQYACPMRTDSTIEFEPDTVICLEHTLP